MIPIRYFADLNKGTGYNNAARGYIRALETIGYSPDTLRVKAAMGSFVAPLDLGLPGRVIDNDADDFLTTYSASEFNPPAGINIVHCHPTAIPLHWTAGYYNIAIAAWETDRLPRGKVKDIDGNEMTVAEHLNRFDEVWVPRHLVRQTFINSGVTKPVHVIPHALLPELLERPIKKGPIVPSVHPKVDPGRDNKSTPLNFYFIGTWNERKNPHALLRAYFSAGWTPKDPVEFWLHCPTPVQNPQARTHYYAKVAAEADVLLNAAPGGRKEVPQFGIWTKPQAYSEVLDRHAAGHVFVTASRSEGFCLPVVEALAMGNLVIGPSVVLDHFQDTGLIETFDTRKVPITPMEHVAGYELDQNWWDIADHEQLREGFLKLLALVQQGKWHGPEVTERVRERYAPASIGRLIAERLQKVPPVAA